MSVGAGSFFAVGCNAGSGFVDATVIDSTTPDARPHIDAEPVFDAPPQFDAVPTGPVQVTVYDPQTGAPVVGRAVAFLNSDDSVAKETVTDDDGIAIAAMASGGSVTVGAADVFSSRPETVVTWLGVNIGDQLEEGVAAVADNLAVTIEIPALLSGTTYDLAVYCPGNVVTSSGTATHVAMMLPSNCTTADAYVEAYDTSSALFAGFAVNGQIFADGGTVQFAGPFKSLTNVSATIENLPQEVSDATMTLSYDLDGNSIGSASQDLTLSAGAGELTGQLVGLPALDFFVSAALVAGTSNIDIITRAATGTSPTLDYNALNVPQLQSIPTFDTTTSTLSWTEVDGGVANGEFIYAEVGDGTTRDFDRLVIAPHDGTSVHVPVLPTSLAQFNPTVTDTVMPFSSNLVFTTYGYDAIRATLIGGLDANASLLTAVGDAWIVSTN